MERVAGGEGGRVDVQRRSLLAAASAGVAAAVLRPFVALGQGGAAPAAMNTLPTIPFGAVYFRKSNPPREDWARDYAQAASDHMNAFRHWFMWSAIEVAPGAYDWSDYDRQLDLAAEHGIATIIAEMLTFAPEWAFSRYPHARRTRSDGRPEPSQQSPAGTVGGWPGLCLDNEEVRGHAEAFLTALAARYRDHPGLGGYDVWNELNVYLPPNGCYCEATIGKFRDWLRAKYGDLKALGEAWYRYSYAGWDDVQPPRVVSPMPDNIDWALFRIENHLRLMQWRIDTIRGADPDHPIAAHAVPRKQLSEVGEYVYPVLQAAKKVDIYGYSGGGQHDEDDRNRWTHWIVMDMTRSASDGKPFWAAEVPSGATWRTRGMPMDRGRLINADDVELYTLTNFAGGATGIFSPRWRPLLDGSFAGSFAFYEMDGSPTDRSEMAGRLSAWANDPSRSDLWRARPVPGDVAIVVVPESQIHDYISHDESTEFYYRSTAGAYQGFLFNNVQPDFIHADDVGTTRHRVLYLPYPVMLPRRVAEALKAWVAGGGVLLSDGCPAYFGDRGRAGEDQPNYGLGEVFGVEQSHVQFTPDLLEGLRVRMDAGYEVGGGVSLQAYATTTGAAIGTYGDGRVAAVDNAFGRGKARLIGTFRGYAYARRPDAGTRRYFADALAYAGVRQHVSSSDENIVARLHVSETGPSCLWVVNSQREPITARLEFSETWGPFRSAEPVRGPEPRLSGGRFLSIDMPARAVAIVRLG